MPSSASLVVTLGDVLPVGRLRPGQSLDSSTRGLFSLNTESGEEDPKGRAHAAGEDKVVENVLYNDRGRSLSLGKRQSCCCCCCCCPPTPTIS